MGGVSEGRREEEWAEFFGEYFVCFHMQDCVKSGCVCEQQLCGGALAEFSRESERERETHGVRQGERETEREREEKKELFQG